MTHGWPHDPSTPRQARGRPEQGRGTTGSGSPRASSRGDRRPPWWPENEPWPPERDPHQRWGWRYQRWDRRAFLFRVGGLFTFVLILVSIGLSRLIAMFAERAGFALPPPLLAFAIFVLVFVMVPVLFFGGMRRVGFPLGDIVSAADRVGRGDFSARIIERGPPFLRTVARAFNAMTTRLEAQEQLRRNLMADVAHELRTPLSVMRGRLEGLLDGVYPRDDATVEQLIEETKVLERLVEDLRTLAHAEAGTLRLQREATDVGVLIDDLVSSLAPAARARGIDLEATLPAELPLVDIDPFRIREVLSNLVTNAIRHTRSGGRIGITAEADAKRLRVEVADSGPGFVPEELPKVFDRFSKGADSQGSGLGLTIARNLIAAHGGEISARNRPEGGASLTFSLPLDTVSDVT